MANDKATAEHAHNVMSKIADALEDAETKSRVKRDIVSHGEHFALHSVLLDTYGRAGVPDDLRGDVYDACCDAIDTAFVERRFADLHADLYRARVEVAKRAGKTV